MKTPIIAGVGTASPGLYMKQKDVLAFYQHHDLMPVKQRELYENILLHGPIDGRCLALDSPREVINESVDAKNRRFLKQARELAARAAESAFKDAGVKPADIGGLVVNTCTGYLCPGLTSYLVQDLGLDSHTKVFDIMGMGCGSALPNLECGCGLLANTKGKPVLCVAVEVCSATHVIDDDPGLTVSNCIFGDGAAAAVLKSSADTEAEKNVPAVVGFETGVFPKYRRELRYQLVDGHLRNTLTRRVPVVGAECLEKATMRLLEEHGMAISDIAWWAVHAGGKSVLDQVDKRFGLRGDELAASREIFRRYGNMSSPTVLFVLKELLHRKVVEGPGLLLAFGAGFTAFAALLDTDVR